MWSLFFVPTESTERKTRCTSQESKEEGSREAKREGVTSVCVPKLLVQRPSATSVCGRELLVHESFFKGEQRGWGQRRKEGGEAERERE